MNRTRSTRRRFLAGSAGVLTATAGCNAVLDRDDSATATPGPTPQPPPEPTAEARDIADRFVDVYRENIDSVVSLQALGSDGAIRLGTGFVYDESHVLTNEHVVEDESRVFVQYRNGEYERAEVVGTDLLSDIAVLNVSHRPTAATPLPFVEGAVPVGREVVALGTPFGLEESLTTGAISGQNRLLTIPQGLRCPDMVQSDAAVNPGNSGGPLLTLDGEVVGIVTAGGGDNIAFVVSDRLARRVVPALILAGEYAHPFLGVGLTNLSPPVAAANGFRTTRGVLVVRVVPGGPAAGTLRGSRREERDGVAYPVGGDVIRAIDDTAVRNVATYARYLALETSPGQTVRVTFVRDGREHTVELTLGNRDETSW